MGVGESYDNWAAQYDTNLNKTRDLEAMAFREILGDLHFDHCLEMGCGTGKNTVWLESKASKVVAVDLSEEMLKKAKNKIITNRVIFHQADLNGNWDFLHQQFDLITFSLVLEHIEELSTVFEKAAQATNQEGYLYVGELHPFKQYNGTKARFETPEGIHVVECFNHHLTDFTEAAKKTGFEIVRIKEFFDDNDTKNIPRILTILFQKKP
jgi:predicted TPR repeat methyltransferase